MVAPFVLGNLAHFVLGLLMLSSGLLETAYAFRASDRRLGNSALLGSATSVVGGLLLLAAPKLALGALAVLLGLSFSIDGVGKMVAAARSREKPGWGAFVGDGLFNVVLGVLIASQWPVSGIVVVGLSVGLRTLSSGWRMIIGRTDAAVVALDQTAGLHPDAGLGLSANPELARLRVDVEAEDLARRRIDRNWQMAFLITFFAIHVGRMDAEWNVVGMLSPAIAVVGDVFFAMLMAWGVVTPLVLVWRRLTRPLERRAWTRRLADGAQDRAPRTRDRLAGRWLTYRFRFAWQLQRCRRSPMAALRRGLHIGLPLTAVLIALNPIWGLTWYFNTENWATGAWEKWADYRVDAWREHMQRAVRAEHGAIPEADLFRVTPEGVAGSADFSFVVIGDTGEGDASQHVLRDRLVLLGERPEVKFLVVSSDVIYPSGAMKDYEPKFYLPFKGFHKPIYAVPGNHDWYDALEAFTANFLEPPAARAALRGRREADFKLTSTTEERIEEWIAEASRLRNLYGIRAANQRSPYFEVQADRFALIVVDTGILKRVDKEQWRWLRDALERARGKFKMAILGHPLFAGGGHKDEADEPFAALHQLLREHEVEVVMGGDTHDLEYYKEVYPASGTDRAMHHFVNGGGGAYLSIGTPLDWPDQNPVADCAYYPRADAVIAKLDEQTPPWKRPVWFWVKRLGGWPLSCESLASAFDFNHAPFFQSFVEVRVEGSAGVVRLIPQGVDGPLRWRDFQLHGQVMPPGKSEDETVEFTLTL